MIKSIEINNFQSHKASRLEFVPGVNIIVGGSDSGKTAILRALKWVATNRPTGDSFRSDWGGETSVHLELDDNTVSRVKGKENLYVLNEVEFTAFGTDVPEEILKALNLSSTNLQQQLDSPFLLSDSSGEVAAHFNKIAHLDVIDSSLKNVDKWIREIKANQGAHQITLQNQTQELEKFENLNYLETILTSIEGKEEKKNDLEIAIKEVEKLLSEIRYTNNKINQKKPLIIMEKMVHNLLEVREILKQKAVDIENLNTLLLSIARTKRQILINKKKIRREKELNSILNKMEERNELVKTGTALKSVKTGLEKIDKNILEKNQIIKLSVMVNKIAQQIKTKQKNEDDFQSFSNLISRLSKSETAIQIKKKALDKLEEEFHEYMPDICPLCGTKIGK